MVPSAGHCNFCLGHACNYSNICVMFIFHVTVPYTMDKIPQNIAYVYSFYKYGTEILKNTFFLNKYKTYRIDFAVRCGRFMQETGKSHCCPWHWNTSCCFHKASALFPTGNNSSALTCLHKEFTVCNTLPFLKSTPAERWLDKCLWAYECAVTVLHWRSSKRIRC